MTKKQKSVDEAWVVEILAGDYYHPVRPCSTHGDAYAVTKLDVDFCKKQTRIRKWRAEKVCEWKDLDVS